MRKPILALTRIFLFSISFLIACSIPSWSFIGNVKIGGKRLPCAVACGPGGGGVLNPNFAGDALTGLVARPAIQEAKDAADATVDRALTKFQELLGKQQDAFIKALTEAAAGQREVLIRQLSDTADSAISRLDEVLKAEIAQADLLLRTNASNLVNGLSLTGNDFIFGLMKVAAREATAMKSCSPFTPAASAH